MIKILIVDDEALTREGIRSSIHWEDFQIDTVLEAENGREGLTAAEREKPEIILTDVRMPQMSGVEMAEQIRKNMPDAAIIFMSGYSDKEYLKAAIRYKAVRYVEKPLNLLELEEAIHEAVSQYAETQQTLEKKAGSGRDREARLAALLSRSQGHDAERIDGACADLGWTFAQDTTFTAIAVKFSERHISDLETPGYQEEMSRCEREIDTYLKPFGLSEVHIYKYDQFMIFFLFGPRPSEETVLRIARKIQLLYTPIGDHFLAVGRTVTGASHAYDSYSGAVILMQSSFFYDRGSIITQPAPGENSHPDTSSYAAAFQELLAARDREGTKKFLADVLEAYRGGHSLLPNQVKDDYYKLFMALENTSRSMQTGVFGESDNILDILDRAHTLYDLHAALQEKTEALFASIENYQPENSTIYAIKDYIARNYMDSMLSVKTIADHVHRSTSYVCTQFKDETDQTLNQYLTEFRIEKAKRMLEDPCSKIAEISSKVGYTDGNYFGKSFKKYVGLSPSEYREKMLK
jgi:two-component system response regulator YesN